MKLMKPNFRGEKIRVVQNRSHSSPDKYYETIKWSNGDYTCNCRGWILPKNGNPRTCRHVKDMAGCKFKGRDEQLKFIDEGRDEQLKFMYDSKSWDFPEGRLYTPLVRPKKKYYRMIRVAE